METYPFRPSGIAEAAAHEAAFGSRNPNLLLRSDRHLVSFRDGEYRTADPDEIDFLLRVVADEERGNRGVWVRQLPAAPTSLITGSGDGAGRRDGEGQEGVAVSSPRPESATGRGGEPQTATTAKPKRASRR